MTASTSSVRTRFIGEPVPAEHPLLCAHRGFSGQQPEMTIAAYRAAIAWSAEKQIPISLECDVHFSADDELICLHDLDVDRTSAETGLVFDRTVAELKQIDFGSWKVADPEPEQRELTTLRELMVLVAQAREAGTDVSLAIETKHPNPRGLEIEERVAALVTEFGWDTAGSPVRVISFNLAAVERIGELLPAVSRTFLIEIDFGPWIDGHLPEGLNAIGPDIDLIRRDPEFVARAREHGNEVHVWTLNKPADIELCRDLGVVGFTTDHLDRVADRVTFAQSSPRVR